MNEDPEFSDRSDNSLPPLETENNDKLSEEEEPSVEPNQRQVPTLPKVGLVSCHLTKPHLKLDLTKAMQI